MISHVGNIAPDLRAVLNAVEDYRAALNAMRAMSDDQLANARITDYSAMTQYRPHVYVPAGWLEWFEHGDELH